MATRARERRCCSHCFRTRLTVAHHHNGLLERSPIAFIDRRCLLDLGMSHVGEKPRDVIHNRQRLVRIHEDLALVLIGDGK